MQKRENEQLEVFYGYFLLKIKGNFILINNFLTLGADTFLLVFLYKILCKKIVFIFME